MSRYAVLLDLEDPEMRPIALVTEHDDEVRVHFAVDCGLRTNYQDPYDVLEPDGEMVRYVPGMTEYFNSVINTLSRSFVVSELEAVESLDTHRLIELYTDRVILPREGSRRVAYTAGQTGRTFTLTGTATMATKATGVYMSTYGRPAPTEPEQTPTSVRRSMLARAA